YQNYRPVSAVRARAFSLMRRDPRQRPLPHPIGTSGRVDARAAEFYASTSHAPTATASGMQKATEAQPSTATAGTASGIAALGLVAAFATSAALRGLERRRTPGICRSTRRSAVPDSRRAAPAAALRPAPMRVDRPDTDLL